MNDADCLEDLDLTELGVTVRSFRNLFYHRTVLLDGIRRIATRNLIHLRDVMHQCDAHVSSSEEGDWIPSVQAKMLSDQGLEDNKLNRIVIECATFYPVQVYLALLYAEIEYARKMRSRSKFFEDDELFRYVDGNEEAITKLHEFRDSFLHPKSEGGHSEAAFLAHSNSYNAAPEMQAALDGYLHRLKQKLIIGLDDAVSRLPKIERLHCIAQALIMIGDRMDLHRDLEGVERVVARMKKLESEMEDVLEEFRSWVPTARQAEAVRTLSQCMSDVCPSAKELQSEIPSRRQPPMKFLFFQPLFSGSGGEGRYGDSRVAIHAMKNAGFISRLLIAAAVMINEAGTGQGRRGGMIGSGAARPVAGKAGGGARPWAQAGGRSRDDCRGMLQLPRRGIALSQPRRRDHPGVPDGIPVPAALDSHARTLVA